MNLKPAVILIVLSLPLSGCGNKGPLVLPTPGASADAATVVEPAAAADATAPASTTPAEAVDGAAVEATPVEGEPVENAPPADADPADDADADDADAPPVPETDGQDG